MKDRTITSLGGLLPRDLLDRISTGDVTLGGIDPTDYGLAPEERLRDAITRSWNRLVGVWRSFRKAEEGLVDTTRTATSMTRQRWLRPLFDELGFAGLPLTQSPEIDGKSYPISHQWGQSAPIHLLGCRVPIDRRTPGVSGAARVSPHALVQEFLNRSDDHLWGMVSNGLVLRVLRDNASLTRAAYLEFDVAAIFDGEAYSDFVRLWMTCHRSRFEGSPPEKCFLEQWSSEAASAGTRALDRLREGVENAIISLGEGFLAARDNGALRERVRSGELEGQDFLRQILRLVYRLLFLLVAESRDLLLNPSADETARIRYRRFYSVERLRDLSHLRRGTPHSDLWRGLQITMGALDADHPGIPELGLKPLGSFLWSSGSIPDLADASLENGHLLAAIRRLTLVQDVEAKAKRGVDYHHLGTTELGSVYESLLELHPEVNVEARSFRLASAMGGERKTTGSYYTPAALIERLLDEALDPILDQAERSPDPEAALLDLKVLDPACGSGHFLIAAAHRIAGRLATQRTGGIEPTPGELRTAVRDVIGRCLYGIDINPMAVELCKVSLWLEANTPGRPLGFLDHHIVCGNSLLGTTPELLENGVPKEAFKALSGDDKEWLKQLRKTNLAQRKQRSQGILALEWSLQDDMAELAGDIAALDEDSDETAGDVAAKADLYDDIRQSETFLRNKLAADAWCAAFVIPKQPDEPPITDDTVRSLGEGHDMGGAVVERVRRLADQYQFLHPHLAFPDVFERGGFDAVLGNPPWDQIQYDPRETFAISHPEIAEARTMAIRNRLIAALADSDRHAHSRYLRDVRHLDGIKHFIHATRRYPLGSVGRLNTAPLFVELMWNSIDRGGRVGVITPTGIATDSFTQGFFRAMINRQALVSLYDFENRQRIFPGVHRSYKFCLLTLTGADVPVRQSRFAFFLQRPEEAADPDRAFPMSRRDFALFNPNTRTCPIFRTTADMEIAAKLYKRAGVLWTEKRGNLPESNPWEISFQLMFMMNTDSHHFRTHQDLMDDGYELRGNTFVRGDQTYLPLYEAKLFHQYDHRFATFEGVSAKELRGGKAREMTSEKKQDPEAVVVPRYWVPAREVIRRTSHNSTGHGARGTGHGARGTGHEARGTKRESLWPWQDWLASRFPQDHQLHQRANRHLHHDPALRSRRLSGDSHGWWLVFRDIARSTDARTSIFSIIPGVGVSNKAPLLNIDPTRWLQAFRNITNSTNERTIVTGLLPEVGVGHSASLMNYDTARAIASTLVMANMNSLPFDWTARLSVGGTNMNFYLVKQFPVLPPETYLEELIPGQTCVEAVTPRALELTYTSWEMEPYARDLGYDGPPFIWDDDRRHRLKSELDAIYAHMYRLDRTDLEHILDAPPPSASFPTLKRNELKSFGEYRTQRYVLTAYDRIAGGNPPDLTATIPSPTNG